MIEVQGNFEEINMTVMRDSMGLEFAHRAGLNKKITPHALRRTFGTTLYESTGDIYLTANALHHKSVDTTRTHYVRKNRELTRDAVTKLDIFNKK